MKHVMLDIETLGAAPDGVIIQVGACPFELDGTIGETRCVNVDPEDCIYRGGLRIDVSTVDWWLRQPARSRTFFEHRIDMYSLIRWIDELAAWGSLEGVWTNAPLFDFAILRTLYRNQGLAGGLKVPWTHRQERCARTLLYLAGQTGDLDLPERSGVHHNAGDDARYQAEVVVACWRRLWICG